ncbi:MAG TPA: hypothetical protein VFK57_09005 [Vicinamibacterales bacterium]|nr:hypothetical protein [Vicinamibacterales bacterium]
MREYYNASAVADLLRVTLLAIREHVVSRRRWSVRLRRGHRQAAATLNAKNKQRLAVDPLCGGLDRVDQDCYRDNDAEADRAFREAVRRVTAVASECQELQRYIPEPPNELFDEVLQCGFLRDLGAL